MRTLFVTMCSCLLMMSFPTGAWAKKGFKAQHVILIGLDAWGSYSMEKAEIRTPFVIAGKRVHRRGAFTESMVQYDVAATIAHIFGLKQPQVWTGRAMTQLFK